MNSHGITADYAAYCADGPGRRKVPAMMKRLFRTAGDYIFSALLAAALTLGCQALRGFFTETDIIMVFLTGAVAVAAFFRRGAAVFYAALAVSSFNYFFIEPLYSFNVYNSSYWLTFAVMFFACLVISTLAARLQEQAAIARRREEDAVMLYELTRDLSALASPADMADCLLRHLGQKLALRARLRLGDVMPPQNVSEDGFTITGGRKVFGQLLLPKDPARPADKTRTLETAAGLLGAALERIENAGAAEKARIAAETEKTRSLLLSAVSHDLRSPLAAISGAAETLLQRGPAEPLLAGIHRESTRLAKVISNMLDVTRMEGGRLRLNMRGYAPAEIIGSAVSAAAAALKDHPLALAVEDPLPFVRMDGLLISQLIQNLLENAARHTPAGTSIELAAFLREGSLCLAVSDAGPGIPAGRERDIFNKFVTLSPESAKGAGLGLAICQAIAAAHGGTIYAANRAQGGARFTLELPPALTLPEEDEDAG